MGKSTISMAIFNSYVSLPEGILMGYFNGILVWGDLLTVASLSKSSDDPAI